MSGPHEHESLEARLKRISLPSAIDDSAEYYALTLTSNDGKTCSWSCLSHFRKYTDAKLQRELREASLIRARVVAEIWESLGEPFLVVNDDEDLFAFFLRGGHGLLAKAIAERYLADVIAPSEVAATAPTGFRATASLTTELRRAPIPRLRMAVIQRDDYRCRICGRRPADYTDVELHVHHIRPWAQGGLSERANLITLCHTCHKGLDPHYEVRLFELSPEVSLSSLAERQHAAFVAGVAKYREVIARLAQQSRAHKGKGKTRQGSR